MKFILIPLLIIALIGGGVFLVKSWWCGLKAGDMGVMHKFTIVSGCLMSTDGKLWMPDERFRIIDSEEQ